MAFLHVFRQQERSTKEEYKKSKVIFFNKYSPVVPLTNTAIKQIKQILSEIIVLKCTKLLPDIVSLNKTCPDTKKKHAHTQNQRQEKKKYSAKIAICFLLLCTTITKITQISSTFPIFFFMKIVVYKPLFVCILLTLTTLFVDCYFVFDVVFQCVWKRT